jgi:hypothetical protein
MSAKEKTVRVDLTLRESGALWWTWHDATVLSHSKKELPQWTRELDKKLKIANDKLISKALEKRKKAK